MGSRRLLSFLLLCISICAGLPVPAFADSAQVLPKGVFKADTQANFYFNMDKRFDPDGHTEDVSTDFNGTLNSQVFPPLGTLDNVFFGGVQGTAVIGNSVVKFNYEVQEIKMTFTYGLTEKVTVGLIVPYRWQTTKVTVAQLDNSTATVGKNPFFGQPNDPFRGAPLIPLSLGGQALTTEDAQNLLGAGLVVNGILLPGSGLGYQRLETWADSGFGDLELGGRYQYWKSTDWRFAFTGGVRFPTGKVDDPDNLVDTGFGSGAYALLFRLNNDYTGIDGLILNLTLRYDLTLPVHETKRVRTSVNAVLAPPQNKEEVKINTGDWMEIETSGTYSFSKVFFGSLLYRYAGKGKDSVSGNRGLNYSSLEEETDSTYQMVRCDVTLSTVPLFVEKKFKVPMDTILTYGNVFAGSNNFVKQQWFGLTLSLYF